MALFGKYFTPQLAPVFVPVHVRPQLSDRVKNLPVVCTRHGMPIPMRFSGATYSASGHPVGNFRCPIPGCTAVEGYGIDIHTNQPRRIFARG
jgi:hypothetical protein